MSAEPELLIVRCRCGHGMKVPAAAMGRTCTCVKCAEKFPVTRDNTRAPQQAAAASTEAAPSRAQSAADSEAAAPAETSPIGKADRRVGRLLVEDGLVTEPQLQEALAQQAHRGGKLFEILIELKYLGKKDLHAFLSKQSGVASIDLKHYDIPFELVSLIPREFAQQNIILPIDKLGKLLTVGMACPLDTATIAELERITGLRVKAMLCAFDDIHAAIDRYYPSENQALYRAMASSGPKSAAPKTPSIPREQVIAQIDPIEVLPPLSTTWGQVQAAEAAQSSVRDLAGIVCTDPAVTAKLLSVANATAYGLPGRVTDINLAAAVLGVEGMKTVLQTIDTSPAPPIDTEFDCPGFWSRSMFCAAAAMSIARASGRGRVGDAYTAGLLHEIGRLALAVAVPDPPARPPDKVPSAEGLKAEQAVFSLTHPEAGYLLAQRWRLPAALAAAIRFHHDPTRTNESEDLVAVVALAAVLAEAHDRGVPSAELIKQQRSLLTYLVMDESKIGRIYDQTSATLARLAEQKADSV